MSHRPQPQRLKWPLTPSQVEGLDAMLEILFRQQRALELQLNALQTSSTSSLLGPQGYIGIGIDGTDGLDGPPGQVGAPGPIGPPGSTGGSGQDGRDSEDSLMWPVPTNDAIYVNSLITPWVTPAFSAGDFTSDVGTWVVASGDVLTHRYLTIGSLMVLSLELTTTTVTGTPNILQVKIPGGKSAANTTSSPALISDNGTLGTGRAQILPSVDATLVRCFTPTAVNWANATDTTYVRYTLVFETL